MVNFLRGSDFPLKSDAVFDVIHQRYEKEEKMSAATDLTTGLIFHVLRAGEADSKGPYSKEELEDMLSDERISPSDYVFFSGLQDWQKIEDVFDFKKGPSDFSTDGQDRETVSISFSAMLERSESDEEILYIAVQEIAPCDRISEILQSTPHSVVLTNQRISIIEPKLIGNVEIEDYTFDDIEVITSPVNRRSGGNLLKIELCSGKSVDIESIPNHQVSRFIELAEETFQSLNS